MTNTAVFLFLSWISGVLELGSIFFALSSSFTVYEIIGLGLAYQIGNLVPNPIQLSRLPICCLAFIAVSMFGAAFFIGGYGFLFIGFMCISAVIQSLRAYSKDEVSTGIKRCFRILGFISAPFFGLSGFILSCIVIFFISLQRRSLEQKNSIRLIRPSSLNWIMIVHQMHYFTYTYFLIYLLYQTNTDLFLVSLYFCLGWITYTSVSYFLTSNTYYRYFVWGHLFLFLILLCLASSINSAPMVIILWVLTGFGGGTVFCIEKVNQLTLMQSKKDIIFSENIGHVFGTLAGLFVYYASGNIAVVIYFSGLLALVTMLLMLRFQRANSL